MPSARSHLPAEVNRFVGRRRELTEARRMLTAYRLVTVAGPAGVGKTRLALRAAAQARRTFPDGVHLADLSGLENHLLLGDTLLQALGVVDKSARPATEVLLEHLPGRRALLLLDNCEHLIDACADLVGALLRAAPEPRVLITSREPLGLPGEGVLEVTPASGDDSEALFEERARAVQPGFTVTPDNRATVAELCRRLDHLPLSVELAAARLRVLSLTQILDRTEDRFRLLTRARRAGTRHGSLRASLDLSARTCSKPERTLWARASVFAAEFDLHGAERVCADATLPAAEVRQHLTSLVEKSILTVRRDGPVVRYAWLDTLRAYGRQLLRETGDELTFQRRHRDYYRDLLRPVSTPGRWSELEQALRRLHDERVNVRAALDFSLTEPGEAPAGLDLAGLLAFHWLGSATLREGRQWLERALAAAPAPSPQRARALWAAGWIATEQGDPDAAACLLAEARDLATRLAAEPDLAWAVALDGYAAMRAGDLARARTLLADGLARQHRLGSLDGALAAMSGLAQTVSYLGDPAAEAISRRALTLIEEHHLDASRPGALRSLGLELIRQHRGREATGVLRNALREARRLKQRYGVATALEFLGWAAAGEGQPERAARLLGAARAAYRSIGATRPVPQQDRAARHTTRIRQSLGDRRFAAAYADGEGMAVPQAIRYALAESRPVPAPAGDLSPLTRREQQVAALVARGLGARQIAAELTISTRTAESHVAHIMAKLGLTARTQIAAWIARRQ